MNITYDKLKELNNNFNENRANRVAQNAAVKNGINEAAVNSKGYENQFHSFNINLDQGKITNQKQSGRCWMFSALNVMRYRIIKKLNLKTFELSQSFPLFYDKLERCNYFLESIVKTFDENLNSRIVNHLLKDPMGDGGQWDMFVNLVEKYGVCPKYAFPESSNSSNTAALDNYLTKLLRKYASLLRKKHENGGNKQDIEQMIEGFMKEVHTVLSISLGTPPEKFDFEIRDKDNKFISEKQISPKEFFNKYVEMNLADYVSLINAPTKDKPYNKTYTVKFLGNVVEGKPVKYLNLEIDKLKKAAIAQLKDGEPVWFGCDVGQYFYRSSSILDTENVKVDDLFGLDFSMTKEERLDYSESLMTHAMTFMGVDVDKYGNSNRWRVENSWGKDHGKDGYLLMTDRWFDEYMYQIVVNKKYLDEESRKNFEMAPIELEAWDPMGSLAK